MVHNNGLSDVCLAWGMVMNNNSCYTQSITTGCLTSGMMHNTDCLTSGMVHNNGLFDAGHGARQEVV